MSLTSHPRLVALATAGTLVLLAVAPSSALAAEHTSKHEVKHQAKHKHVKTAHFVAHGTVVSASGSTAVVMARSFQVAHHGVHHNVSLTVTVAPGALKHSGHSHK